MFRASVLPPVSTLAWLGWALFNAYSKKKIHEEGLVSSDTSRRTIQFRYIKKDQSVPIHQEGTASSSTSRRNLSATTNSSNRIVGDNPEGSNVVWHLKSPRHLTSRRVPAVLPTTCRLRISPLTTEHLVREVVICDLVYRQLPQSTGRCRHLPGLYTTQTHCALTSELSPRARHTKRGPANVSYSRQLTVWRVWVIPHR